VGILERGSEGVPCRKKKRFKGLANAKLGASNCRRTTKKIKGKELECLKLFSRFQKDRGTTRNRIIKSLEKKPGGERGLV